MSVKIPHVALSPTASMSIMLSLCLMRGVYVRQEYYIENQWGNKTLD